ncbi:MAG: class I SAM-dependent methyltransferase [Chloroflexi bacterium]|nr:class I SAM-dependent methyltransferase [Chloroflexota bacterium]
MKDGVLRLVAADFAPRLDAFTRQWTAIRKAEGRLLDPNILPLLPDAATVRDDFQWRLRRYDLEVLGELLAGRSGLRALDVGAWNGWLSYRLTQWGHQVTAIDYFADEIDGLAALKFYPRQWRAIQMDLLDLSLLDESFDVVILNRCLQFQPDPVAFWNAARERVAAGGMLLALGLEFFRDASQKAAQVAALKRHYEQKHRFDLFLRPTKGYLDWTDKTRLEAAGMKIRSYPQLRLANLRARVRPRRPFHAYGVVEAG